MRAARLYKNGGFVLVILNLHLYGVFVCRRLLSSVHFGTAIVLYQTKPGLVALKAFKMSNTTSVQRDNKESLELYTSASIPSGYASAPSTC